ncbi:MAG: response regulator [Myxococcota bacterium]|nr:response regulator [Myxococcota bacterium]
MLPTTEAPFSAHHILLVEHSEEDFQRLVDGLQLVLGQSEMRRVEDASGMRRALAERSWDAVISNWSLPQFNALAALDLLKESGLDLPFIVFSGPIGEAAFEVMRAGAHDWVLKDNHARLCSALERELRESKARQARRDVDRALVERTRMLASLNADLQETQDSLRQALHVRDEFICVASHELRTPLTSLKLQIQSLMRNCESTASLADPLKRINRQANRLTELVAQLLDVSRITTGHRLRLEPEEMDLVDLVHEVASRFAFDLEHCGSVLRVHASRPTRGLWDRERMDQVVTNLIGNAIKFGAGKPIDVTIGASEGGARVSVCDHGLGIEPKNQARIFERFERAVPTRQFGGMGLGLWIVRQIVEVSGGTLSVESQLGQGSTFLVELPLSPRAASPVATVAPEPVVLVVDDDADIREAMTMVLKEAGYVAIPFGGGDEALAYLQAHAGPSLILLDLMMPGMDGYAFRSRQLASPELSKIPVVVVTGVGNPQVRTSELGGATVITKPVDIDTLVTTIETHRAA